MSTRTPVERSRRVPIHTSSSRKTPPHPMPGGIDCWFHRLCRPSACPRSVRDRNTNRMSPGIRDVGQVFGLRERKMGLLTMPSQLPAALPFGARSSTSGVHLVFVFSYRCGTAPESHRIPSRETFEAGPLGFSPNAPTTYCGSYVQVNQYVGVGGNFSPTEMEDGLHGLDDHLGDLRALEVRHADECVGGLNDRDHMSHLWLGAHQ